MIRPGGLVVAGLLNPRSIFGALGAVADGRVGEGFSRLRGQGERQSTWNLGEGLPEIPIHFPSPESLKEIYGTRFEVDKQAPIGVITPPAGLGRLSKRGGRLLGRLGRLEKALSPLPPMRKMALLLRRQDQVRVLSRN